jgi:hypothetical protein
MRQIIQKIIKKSTAFRMFFNVLKYISGRASVTTVSPIYFDGWKMATGTRTPWMNGGTNALSREFSDADSQLMKLVVEKKIILTQFNQENVVAELGGLTWRHYLVYWSAKYSIENTKSKNKIFAEFGVCDGLTVFYAISAARQSQATFEVYLYDAWGGMKKELLLDSEKSSAGSYSYLNLENTKNNLKYLGDEKITFNKGYIPEVFASAQNPDHLVWMHIDLNSATPTISSLNRFWITLEIGGLVLLDDFAWPGYEDTQTEVERWACDKNCNILHLPTGQAIIFKLG